MIQTKQLKLPSTIAIDWLRLPSGSEVVQTPTVAFSHSSQHLHYNTVCCPFLDHLLSLPIHISLQHHQTNLKMANVRKMRVHLDRISGWLAETLDRPRLSSPPPFPDGPSSPDEEEDPNMKWQSVEGGYQFKILLQPEEPAVGETEKEKDKVKEKKKEEECSVE